MIVWIDKDLCTGDGLCEEIAPDVFTLLDDGLAYVVEGDKVFSDPGGPEGLAVVPDGQEEATIESAEECPGECIYLEVQQKLLFSQIACPSDKSRVSDHSVVWSNGSSIYEP